MLSARRDTAIGKIYAIRDSMYYPVVRRITTNKQVSGYLLRWRILSTSPKTIEQLSALMGAKAALYIGNEDGSLWTDMIKPVSFYPMNSLQINKAVEQTTTDGKRNLTTVSKINNTPWLVSVEFARQTLLASANRFLRWMIIGGLILLAIGILLAWIMSRNIIRPLNRLTEATSGIAAGNYIPTEGANRRDEVGKLARAFNTMIEQVREARQGLEQKIVESGEMNEQLRNLTAHLQNIREEERIHIAREMHDELGQLLTAFNMDISWLQKRLRPENGDAIFQKLDDMSKLIDDSVVFVRKIASELRPSVLDDFGLIPALEWHSEEFQKRFHIDVEFQTNTKELKTSSLIATGLFRMYQESLTNVARHSNANKVFTRLEVINNMINLSISDNGKGFDIHATDQKKTLGLLGMKERAAMIAGNIRIESAPGKGTTVVITVNRENG
jgi:signal transduction histidine kinase